MGIIEELKTLGCITRTVISKADMAPSPWQNDFCPLLSTMLKA
ncbi:hypothetical protein CLOSTMETH_02072 [[Clostridium] methylpentosum DSM 5476]|uniref:Uncharacterized protein n=1 Tax=[Clostridium] methylpentosum DSM 5476 TaxID=537013 RepID=C0EDZ3_9FIRM|nr:hypothetical protein CLOSTMETH_02072 [[Clostridium] methylpentosum DSM 5476]